jgi:hypothetical protein
MQEWQKGNIDDLFFEATQVQQRLKSKYGPRAKENLSKRFANLVKAGKVAAAVKLLTEGENGGVLSLDDQTMALLVQKHPAAEKAQPNTLLPGPQEQIHPAIFDAITSEVVMKAALKTKGGSGPSGMDSDEWRRQIGTRKYGQAAEEFRKAIALMARRMCREEIATVAEENLNQTSSLECHLACRLIPLAKPDSGVRPIGVGEVLRRIMGKSIMAVVSSDVQQAAGSIQVCAGQKGGSESAIHAFRTIYEDDDCDAVLLVDASNAFNAVNREAMLHNIGRLCPALYMYAQNCYQPHARLFIMGGREIRSCEGTTQGDPIAMPMYALASIPLLNKISKVLSDSSVDNIHVGSSGRANSQQIPTSNVNKQVAFADDAVGSGKLEKLRAWWDAIVEHGPGFGYNVNASKTWLVVKQQQLQHAKRLFDGSGVNITAAGKKHLGAAIGSTEYKTEFVTTLVAEWIKQIAALSLIAESEPHAAYAAFTKSMRHKYTYFMRTIPDIGPLMLPLEEAIRSKLIPALTEYQIVNDAERDLLSLPVRYGGLGLINPSDVANIEFENSVILTAELTSKITGNSSLIDNENAQRSTKIKREQKYTEKLVLARNGISSGQLKLLEINQMPGASAWLSAMPLVENNFWLSKREFWDAVRLRYKWELKKTPSHCACGEGFDITHALSCPLGGFVILRHNEIRDITAELLAEVCKDVRIEPPLEQLTGETFPNRSANVADEARLDVSATGLWIPYQKAFLDMMVINPSAKRYRSIKQAFTSNENKKKQDYCQRVLEVENGSFSPCIFSINGGMGRECTAVYKRIAQLLCEKREGTSYSECITFIRTKLSFAIVRSALRCIRGSRKLKDRLPIQDHDIHSMMEVCD